MTKAPTRKPAARGPINQSRAAGAPAPASRAATAPPSFYDPAPAAYEPASQLGAAAPVVELPERELRAGFKKVFADATRSGAMPLERGGTVDREIAEHMASEVMTDPEELAAEIARIRAFRKRSAITHRNLRCRNETVIIATGSTTQQDVSGKPKRTVGRTSKTKMGTTSNAA